MFILNAVLCLTTAKTMFLLLKVCICYKWVNKIFHVKLFTDVASIRVIRITSACKIYLHNVFFKFYINFYILHKQLWLCIHHYTFNKKPRENRHKHLLFCPAKDCGKYKAWNMHICALKMWAPLALYNMIIRKNSMWRRTHFGSKQTWERV